MKAIVQDAYGSLDVLCVHDIDPPHPADDEVLVRVHAASVHPDVWHVVRGEPYVLRLMGAGLRKPKCRVPGTDVAGHVASVGAKVTRFRVGDEVYGETVRGHQWQHGGAYAEYVSVPEAALARKPAHVTFVEAAAVPTSGLIALHGLRHEGRLQPGQRVLINGAGGGVGTFAVQLAKAYGAHVTGVDAASKLDLIRALGADRAIDYAKEAFTETDEPYDLVLDVAGNHPFWRVRRALTPRGTYVLVGHDHFGATGRPLLGGLPRALTLMAAAPFAPHLPRTGFSRPSQRRSMDTLTELLEAGKLTPFVDATYPLEEVPAALRHLQSGRVRGKLVITV